MRRGDLVTIALPGDFGKPRPALVLQSDFFQDAPTVTVLLLSSTERDAPLIRIQVNPDEVNGLRKPCQIMVDKTMTVRRDKVGEPFGRIGDETMIAVSRAIVVSLGLA